jgi:hypothetical protein
LQYFLDLQGDVIGRRQVGGAWCCAHSLIQTLDAARDRASELFRKIKFAVITVEKANAALPQAA